MAGKASRRARQLSLEAEEAGELEPDDVDDEPVDEEPAPRRVRPALLPRFLDWVNQSNHEGSSVRMQGRDAIGSYAASVVLVVIPLVFIAANATHHGAALPSPIFQAAGAVLGLLTALSVRLENRILTPLAGVISVLVAGFQPTAIPRSVQWLSEVHLIVGMALALVLYMRQSRARGAQTAERRAAQRQARSQRQGRGGRDARGGKAAGRKGAKEPEPTGPAASRRYTPPKNRSSA